ncbi:MULTISPECIES: glycosyltransferase family 1 protein [unclassified Rhodococcus (in: high G+C Gram-positive bacteria)]|uniref:glycosyltransferase family 1 protein n=1 Tax=unclassified Rhodococcus (in: high G+C Gram-positive bacteria) TaxID=192944 RepID=UPI00163A5181|nr:MULTISPECIES: glycosyltransferase family 1 protein [unclassified Rhodococcus (in: high G+C Gram-positive bacteria)]MBC2641970.1 glycosyltransferase family 1 protein [Rhodococcus sp. 3A]MBC2893289.1 glycosyltransferase family 1 protein [Rhodococcus sp. 4CII]
MIRVASVPASHVYVRHLADPDGHDQVVRLPDPVPADGRKVPGGWWPPVMLDPRWISRHHREFDVFHIHFGFDAISPDVMNDVLHELSVRHVPVVYSVHDLRNPHQRDPEQHLELLDVLVPAAAQVITLTTGAAAAIDRRWARTAAVLRHPHVVERPLIDRPRARGGEFVVGVHVKSMRANMDPFPILDVLADTVSQLECARLRINVHDEIFEPANYWYAPDTGARLLRYRGRKNVDVVVHPYFSDEQLWDYLSSLSVSVLPYRFGTHSGWLEACYDLGTAVAAPSCGFYGEQQDCAVFGFDEEHFDADSLDGCIRTLYDAEPVRATGAERASQRRALARAHHSIYQKALS